MSSFIKTMLETLKGTIVGTLSLCFKASNIIEKICWLSMWVLGSIYVSIILFHTFESWNLNPTISSRKWIDLSEVVAPAITFCHQGNTRMEVADRLLQAAGDNSVKVRKLRNRFLKHSVEKLLHFESTISHGKRFNQQPFFIKKIYKETCLQQSDFYIHRAQLWKMHQLQLKSKQGLWNSFNKWKFKDREVSIYIENSSKTKVLGITKDSKVILEVKDEQKDEQLWKKGVPDNEGYFTLENENGNGKVMTAVSSNGLEIKDPYKLQLCDHYNIAFSYAKKHNLTTEKLYQKIFFDLYAEDNISNGLTKIWIDMKANTSETYKIDEFLDNESNQWVFLENIDALFSIVLNTPLKNPLNFDTSVTELIRSGNTMEKWEDENWNTSLWNGYQWDLDHKSFSDKWEQDLIDIMNIFSLPNAELNLMAISHFYTMNNFGQLGRQDLFTFKDGRKRNELALGEIPKSFRTCFEQMYEELFGKVEETEDTIFGEPKLNASSIKPSPCKTISQEHPCKAYCDWHETFFHWSLMDKKEFLTLMKLSLPQRRLLMPSLSEADLSLTKKVFGANHGSSKPKKQTSIASMALVMFCRDDINEDWLGDDIGMTGRLCSDFYPTPTDQGICQTKNLNFENQISFSEEFTESFETNKQKQPPLVQGNRLNSKATIIIETNSEDTQHFLKKVVPKTFSRSGKLTSKIDIISERLEEMQEVNFQIHPSNELPQILNDYSKGTSMDSLILKRGHEYFIEVAPSGQTVSEDFKSMNYEDRNCLLSNELPENSTLKKYSKQNCKYECRINIAKEKCDCIPWDFPVKTTNDTIECDVFGRTCFLNAIKYATTGANVCHQCKDDCEFMEYHKTKVTEKKTDTIYFAKWPKYLREYFMDVNGTIEPLTWFEELRDSLDQMEGKEKSSMRPKKGPYFRSRLDQTITIHVNFASQRVEMNVIGTRYTFSDKLGKLGGTMGLGAQITGATFFATIHLVVLLFKAIFRWCSQYEH